MPTTDALSALIYLTAAIDAGDDSVLLILADVLEEMGDPRAAGLRRVRYFDTPFVADNETGWYYTDTDWPIKNCIPVRLHNRMRPKGDAGKWVGYPTRSAAILALAAALTLEEKS